jgi:hypothetical protein
MPTMQDHAANVRHVRELAQRCIQAAEQWLIDEIERPAIEGDLRDRVTDAQRYRRGRRLLRHLPGSHVAASARIH